MNWELSHVFFFFYTLGGNGVGFIAFSVAQKTKKKKKMRAEEKLDEEVEKIPTMSMFICSFLLKRV
jgi:hypothetical protein